jgi:hypothetical protein
MMQKAKFYAQRLFTNVPDNLNTILKFDAILVKTFARIFQQHIRVTKCKTIHIVALENDVKNYYGVHKDYTGTIELKQSTY